MRSCCQRWPKDVRSKFDLVKARQRHLRSALKGLTGPNPATQPTSTELLPNTSQTGRPSSPPQAPPTCSTSCNIHISNHAPSRLCWSIRHCPACSMHLKHGGSRVRARSGIQGCWFEVVCWQDQAIFCLGAPLLPAAMVGETMTQKVFHMLHAVYLTMKRACLSRCT